MKQPTTKTDNKPKAAEVLTDIAEAVLAFRDERGSLNSIARIVERASGLLRINDRDERAAIANAATVALARKHNLMG